MNVERPFGNVPSGVFFLFRFVLFWLGGKPALVGVLRRTGGKKEKTKEKERGEARGGAGAEAAAAALCTYRT